jgi:hypothetical protein
MNTSNSHQQVRHELVLNEARRMAHSGEYTDWRQLERALREADLAESLDVVGGANTRTEFDKLCRESRKTPSNDN